MITYKFRLYPTEDQERKLLETLEICRQTYNYFLSKIKESDKIPSRLELQSELPKLKKEKPEVNYSPLTQGASCFTVPKGTPTGYPPRPEGSFYITFSRKVFILITSHLHAFAWRLLGDRVK